MSTDSANISPRAKRGAMEQEIKKLKQVVAELSFDDSLNVAHALLRRWMDETKNDWTTEERIALLAETRTALGD